MFLNVQMDSGVVDNAAGVEKESIEFRRTALFSVKEDTIKHFTVTLGESLILKRYFM